MELFLQVIVCFVFVAVVQGQSDYGRRQRMPVVPVPKQVPYNTGPELFDPNMGQFSNGLSSLRGGSMDMMPEHIRKIIGSTISGGSLVGGVGGMPRHGGTLNANGMINGWGADGSVQAIPAITMWNDPLSGSGFPTDYSGQELVFDPISNSYVAKKAIGIAAHQVAKPPSHVAVKSGGIIRGGMPSSHGTMVSEHGIVKEATHIAGKTIGIGGAFSPVGGMGGGLSPVRGMGGVLGPVRGMGSVMKPVGGIGGSLGPKTVVGPVGHGIMKSSVQHGAVMSSGMIAAGRPLVYSGPISAGHVGFDNPGVIAHNVDFVVGHNRAKAFGNPVGIGFINPGGPIATQIGHDSAKATSGMGFMNPMGPVAISGIGIDPFGVGVSPLGPVSHGNPIINHGMMNSGTHIGVSKLGALNAGHVGIDAPQDIIHTVGKATLGADSVMGHSIAKSSGNPVGMGFINPMGRVASQMGHDIVKATSGIDFINSMGPVGTSGFGIDPFGQVPQIGVGAIGHNMVKATGGGGMRPIGVGGGPMTNPVHNVDKVGQMGIARVGHDPIAARIGHVIAKQAIGHAAVAVDIGSRGGVSAGNPFAVAATKGLAKESLHVAGKTINMASSGAVGGRQVVPWINNGMFDQGAMIQPQIVQKPPPKMTTEYGRRVRV